MHVLLIFVAFVATTWIGVYLIWSWILTYRFVFSEGRLVNKTLACLAVMVDSVSCSRMSGCLKRSVSAYHGVHTSLWPGHAVVPIHSVGCRLSPSHWPSPLGGPQKLGLEERILLSISFIERLQCSRRFNKYYYNVPFWLKLSRHFRGSVRSLLKCVSGAHFSFY